MSLKKTRKKAGLTLEQVASVLGITKQAVSAWETGKRRPDIKHLPTLAILYNTTVDEIVKEVNG